MTPTIQRLKRLEERHERLVKATQQAPHGRKLDYLRLTRQALHERLRAELEAQHG